MTTPAQPQAILLVPTSVGAGLTSACLGLIQALDTIGLKAGFLKTIYAKRAEWARP